MLGNAALSAIFSSKLDLHWAWPEAEPHAPREVYQVNDRRFHCKKASGERQTNKHITLEKKKKALGGRAVSWFNSIQPKNCSECMWKTFILSRLKGSLTQRKLQFSFRSMKEKSKGSCSAQRASLRRQRLHWMTSLKLDAPLTAIIPDVLASFTSPSVSRRRNMDVSSSWSARLSCSQMCESKSETAPLSGIHKTE